MGGFAPRFLKAAACVVALVSSGWASEVYAQKSGAEVPDPRAMVEGGIYDKPFIARLGATSLGGYADLQFRFERVDGVTEALTFVPERFNLFTFSPVSERVRVIAELEIEEAGEEIALELAAVDFELHPAAIFRAGVLLAPLGRFNLAHDAPANDLIDRPLVSTEIIPSTLSEAGMGFYGFAAPSASWLLTWELYLVNGLADVVAADEGTRVAAGKGNFEDNNNSPALTGRFGLSPTPSLNLGASFHTGRYNVFKIEGLKVDNPRMLTIVALDWEGRWGDLTLEGEAAGAFIDLPGSLSGLFARRQRGLYTQLGYRFLDGAVDALPRSSFNASVRLDLVDFDTEVAGDDVRRLTLGVNFRPTDDTALKLDYQATQERDGLLNPTRSAALLFGVASYF